MWKKWRPQLCRRPTRRLSKRLLGSKNNLHNNYQDFQAFLDHGGHIGLQHDPLLYGAYALNPFLVSVEMVPMLMVKQGQVAVIKAYVGLATQDTSERSSSMVRSCVRGTAACGKSRCALENIHSNPRCSTNRATRDSNSN
jgi:hypothetical protein